MIIKTGTDIISKFLASNHQWNTRTCYGTCDELRFDVEDAVIGFMQSGNIKKYFHSTFDYNYRGHNNGFSSNVTESKFMVSIYILGRMSYVNSDSTVVPETTLELEGWVQPMIIY